jgi:hypothetical protein
VKLDDFSALAPCINVCVDVLVKLLLIEVEPDKTPTPTDVLLLVPIISAMPSSVTPTPKLEKAIVANGDAENKLILKNSKT